ncbi:MAG TPA: hypothetical protein VG892_10215, partial [Terriglobales bacterium]|nr:hypothetical protein [Terriglobales bacterium]
HYSPSQVLRPSRRDMKNLIQFHSIRQETKRMQGAIRRKIEDVALIPGDSRGQNRSECNGWGQARTFHFVDATGRQPALRKPAIDRIGNRNDT